MNRQWMSLFFDRQRKVTKRKLVAAQFSIEGCAETSVLLSEN
jgi:hypothetical protein